MNFNTLSNQYSITAHLSKRHQAVETHSLDRMNFKFMAALGWAIVSVPIGPLQNSIRSYHQIVILNELEMVIGIEFQLF